MTGLDVLPRALTAELAGAGDVETACALATARLQQAGLPLVSIYLLSGDLLRCLGVHGYGQLYDGIPPGVGVIGRAYATGTRQHVRVGVPGAAYRAAACGVIEELALPLHADGVCIGVLNAESTHPFEPGVVPALDGAAQVLSRALTALGGPPAENQAQRLVRYATSLSEAHDLPDLAARLLAAARTVSGLSTAALVSGRGALLLAADGVHAERLKALTTSELTELLPWVRHGASSRSSGERGLQPTPVQTMLERAGLCSFVLVPVVSRQELFAVLLVGDARSEPVASGVVETLELLAALGAADLRSMRATHQLREQARTDPLTGLPHRRAFDEALQQALVLAPSAAGLTTAVVLVDLDHFKAINDAHGHPAGDEVLRRVARSLALALRSQDALHRIGGDEFAAVLEVQDVAELQAVADRLVEAGRAAGTSVSVGGCLAEDGDDPECVVARVDAALYAAKAAGRDCARVPGHGTAG